MRTIDIAIPVLNEEQYIGGCLDSVVAFEKPADVHCTVFVLDGGSSDRTREIAGAYAAKHPEIRVCDNPGRIQSCALNLVLREGRGAYILRLDAHCAYPSDYLAQCLETAARSQADNVGGVVRTRPGGESYQARLVQALTTHRFGVGNAQFRLEPGEGPVDTVPFGFFKRATFERIGWFDERLERAQDYEMNRRIRASGGRVWLNPRIQAHYYNQPTLTKFLRKQLEREAPYVAYLWYVAPYAFAWRHGISGAFVAGLVAGCLLSPFSALIRWPFLAVLAVYALLATGAAVQQAARYRAPLHLLSLPIGFFLFHTLHGLGVLWGLIRVATGTAPVQQKQEPWPGAGRRRAFPNTSGPGCRPG